MLLQNVCTFTALTKKQKEVHVYHSYYSNISYVASAKIQEHEVLLDRLATYPTVMK